VKKKEGGTGLSASVERKKKALPHMHGRKRGDLLKKSKKTAVLPQGGNA